MSVKDALNNYYKKQMGTANRQKRKNKKPEKEVEKKVLAWAAKHGFDLQVFESKAVYSASAGRYLHSQASESVSDLIGNNQEIACYIELKAPGRRSTLKEHQLRFLQKKINQGCFACCVDSALMLEDTWSKWRSLKDKEQAKKFLLNYLPKKKQKKDAPQADDTDLPF